MVTTTSCRRRGGWWCWWLPLACCSVVLVSWPSPAAAAATTVTSLPGFDGPLPFSLETGPLVCASSAQSENNPDEDPLLLWIIGGPGCSGVIALTYEIGPIEFAAKYYYRGVPKLIYRPQTWTKMSNIIFVDSPVGTGFSYATTQEGFKSSDTKAVQQLLIFLKEWLQEHPRFSQNPLYIAGDSYGGMIVPTLTLAIDEKSEGFMWRKIQYPEQCFVCTVGPSYTRLHKGHQRATLLHVLEPSCEEVWSPRTRNSAAMDGTSRLMLKSNPVNDDPPTFECRKASYAVLKMWANDETVRGSLGVHKGTIGRWKRCNLSIEYTRDLRSTVEYHSKLIRKGYRAIIYSGDHDGGMTIVGTQAWIKVLNLSIADDWRPWYVAGEVAGFTRSYANNNLTYATVKGAGHTAPEYKPKECFEMFARWMSGIPL
ncbi:serine carboxypeptidase-like 19 [Oryza brachyantha]|uniref:serine carboxypeptidase-like 19 n=1 Tax=Oryza brachyantha TaxID=4533 RepID=UPI001ADCFE6D|nr:serine carboxypeptidase-like 19 [Oryza brachyantha]